MNDVAGFAGAERPRGGGANRIRISEGSGLLRMMALPRNDEKLLLAMMWGWTPTDIAGSERMAEEPMFCGQSLAQ
jgi:hypothetical protein